MKYNYWHEIIAMSDEYKKHNPEMEVGLLMARKNKHPYSIDIINRDTLKEFKSAYTLKYIGRLPVEASTKEICKMYKEKTKANTEGTER